MTLKNTQDSFMPGPELLKFVLHTSVVCYMLLYAFSVPSCSQSIKNHQLCQVTYPTASSWRTFLYRGKRKGQQTRQEDTNPLNTKRRLLYLKTQSVPRSNLPTYLLHGAESFLRS